MERIKRMGVLGCMADQDNVIFFELRTVNGYSQQYSERATKPSLHKPSGTSAAPAVAVAAEQTHHVISDKHSHQLSSGYLPTFLASIQQERAT